MSIQTPINVAEAIEHIQANEYVLPAIQREFVWWGSQIERLFDSLMRGYPIGAFLFWRIDQDKLKQYQFYRFIDRYHQRDRRHNQSIELVSARPVIAILDGQQRLTALNIGLRGSYADKLPHYRWSSDYAFPERRLHLNLMARQREDDAELAYDFRLLKKEDAERRDHEHYWFPVADIMHIKGLPDLNRYCREHELMGPEQEHAVDTLTSLLEVIKGKQIISYFLETEQDLDKVLNIFIRVNSGGTQLNYSDMLLSIATAKWENRDKNAREEVYDLVDQLNKTGEGFNFSKDLVLKAALVLSDVKNIAFRVTNFNRDNMLIIEELWDRIAAALRTTAHLLARWGYNRDTLVAYNAVIPLAHYILRAKRAPDFVVSPRHADDRSAMRRWLITAILKRTFTGQADSALRRVRRIINDSDLSSFPAEAIYEEFKGTTRPMAFDEDQIDGLLDHHYGGSYTFTILAILYPWLKFENHFHVDHIFPRAKFTPQCLRDCGIPESDWHRWLDRKDDLANLQLLQGRVNQNKSDQEFEAWLMDSQPTDMDLEAYRKENLIPDVDLSFEKYPEFLEARAAIIKQRLTELLG